VAKVQFNCRLDEETRDRIVEIAESRGESQADVIALMIAALDMQTAQGRVQPRKLSKKAAHVEALRASDPMADERPEIDYGNTELPNGGSVSVVGAAIPTAQRPAASMGDWRAGRKPLLKPGDRK
jgi:hypothetical protein